jgi:large subunit ribosomal protein L9
MKVSLLERVERLGHLGDEVTVKPGFARNFLLPQGKALRATADNIAYFEKERKAIEAANDSRKADAQTEAKKLNDLTVDLIRQASESSQLYGSVAARDIAEIVRETTKVAVTRGQVDLNINLKTLGLFTVPVILHPEVKVDVTVNIARTADEAKIQRETGKVVSAEEQEKEMDAKIAEASNAKNEDAPAVDAEADAA